MPQWLALCLVIVMVGAIVYAIMVINHRRLGADDDPSGTPDVIEYMTMMIGVIYAIVLGLAIAGVWEARSAAQDTVQTEAQALHEVSERAQVFAVPEREKIRSHIGSYVTHVVHTEWPAMANHGRLTDRGDELFSRLRTAVLRSEPRTELQGQAYAPMADQVGIADEARTHRAEAAGSTMPGTVWFGLIAGAVVSVGMIFALQIRRTPRELAVAGLFCALFAFLLFLIWDMDAPFGRGLAATADAFLNHFPASTR
ncbi:bestrophin-like domain [Streptomyces flavofungini]|uniref:DUF4239 domain-containing protein n=1 Tax=Streptomyces flavofungini TaxID=68200 RepID=A0ABS0XJB3_9ACTN|nr:DUF4239 domain-containing protein [Streptomyces flavofungini]MBJ3813314.1 DUF4239 domain-containing protein [Streptomyces flavofungini]GHC91359.1 membrane protein [Streptomyces flavofungini]